MKTIKIEPVTRIEGHAKVTIQVDDQKKITEGRLDVLELRGFEKILEGMEIEKMPLITGRICGVCPVAHHLVSAKTLDKVYGVDPPKTAKLLRELMYMGHYIHSHALHFFVLGGPDLIFGIDSDAKKRNIVGLVEKDPKTAKKALRLRTLGQKIVEMVGGRGVHPVTAIPGGITFQCDNEKKKILLDYAKESLSLTQELLGTAKTLIDAGGDLINELENPTYYLGTVNKGKLNFYDGKLRCMNKEGKIVNEFDASDYKKYIIEDVIPTSYMKPVYYKDGGAQEMYRVGSLARINVVDGMETPLAQKEFEEFRKKYGQPTHKTVLYHLAKVIELLYACEKAVKLMEDSEITSDKIRVPITKKATNAIAHIEAPRGVLIHDYEVDDKARVKKVNLIIATQQNYASINESIRQAAVKFIEKSDHEILNGVEFAIRCYDPCLSCATHMVGQMKMEIKILKQGKLERLIRRL